MEAPVTGLCSLSRTRPVTVGAGHGVSEVGSGERQGFAAGAGGRTGAIGAIAAALAVVDASMALGDCAAFGESAGFGVSVVFDGSTGFDALGAATAGVDGMTDSLWPGALGLSSEDGRISINEPTRAACGADLVPGDRMTYPRSEPR